MQVDRLPPLQSVSSSNSVLVPFQINGTASSPHGNDRPTGFASTPQPKRFVSELKGGSRMRAVSSLDGRHKAHMPSEMEGEASVIPAPAPSLLQAISLLFDITTAQGPPDTHQQAQKRPVSQQTLSPARRQTLRAFGGSSMRRYTPLKSREADSEVAIPLCRVPVNPSELLSLRVVLLTLAASLPGAHHASPHPTVGAPIPMAMKNVDLRWLQKVMVRHRAEEDSRLKHALKNGGRVGEASPQFTAPPAMIVVEDDSGPTHEFSTDNSLTDTVLQDSRTCGSPHNMAAMDKAVSRRENEAKQATMNLLNFDELRLANDPVHHYDQRGDVIHGAVYDSLQRRKVVLGSPKSQSDNNEELAAEPHRTQSDASSKKSARKLLTLINSPRSAVICLRNGVTPYNLLQRPSGYYARPGDGDAPAFRQDDDKGTRLSVQEIHRWRCQEAEKHRVALLAALRDQYRQLTSLVTLESAIESMCTGVVGGSLDRVGHTREGLAQRREEELLQLEQRILWASKIDEVKAQQRQEALATEMHQVRRMQANERLHAARRTAVAKARREAVGAKERRRLACVEKKTRDREAQLAQGIVKAAESAVRLEVRLKSQRHHAQLKALVSSEKKDRSAVLADEAECFKIIQGEVAVSKSNLHLARHRQRQAEMVAHQKEHNKSKASHRDRCNVSAALTEEEQRDRTLISLTLASIHQQRLEEALHESNRAKHLSALSRLEHGENVKMEATEVAAGKRQRAESRYNHVIARQRQIEHAESVRLAWEGERFERDAALKGMATNCVVEQSLFGALVESAKMQQKLDILTLNDAQQRLQVQHIQQVRVEARGHHSKLMAAKEEVLRKVEAEHSTQRYLLDHPIFKPPTRGYVASTSQLCATQTSMPGRYSEDEFESCTSSASANEEM